MNTQTNATLRSRIIDLLDRVGAFESIIGFPVGRDAINPMLLHATPDSDTEKLYDFLCLHWKMLPTEFAPSRERLCSPLRQEWEMIKRDWEQSHA